MVSYIGVSNSIGFFLWRNIGFLIIIFRDSFRSFILFGNISYIIIYRVIIHALFIIRWWRNITRIFRDILLLCWGVFFRWSRLFFAANFLILGSYAIPRIDLIGVIC